MKWYIIVGSLDSEYVRSRAFSNPEDAKDCANYMRDSFNSYNVSIIGQFETTTFN